MVLNCGQLRWKRKMRREGLLAGEFKSSISRRQLTSVTMDQAVAMKATSRRRNCLFYSFAYYYQVRYYGRQTLVEQSQCCSLCFVLLLCAPSEQSETIRLLLHRPALLLGPPRASGAVPLAAAYEGG
jgi:hypothetical protein